jgi:cell division protein FtsB
MPELSGVWIALAALILAAATLWNGSRRTTVDMLEKQVRALKEEVEELRDRVKASNAEVAELRAENYKLMRDLMRKPGCSTVTSP